MMLAILVAAFLLGVQGGIAVLPMDGGGVARDGDGDEPASGQQPSTSEVSAEVSPPSVPTSGSPTAPEPEPEPAASSPAGVAVGLAGRADAASEAGDAPPEDPAEPIAAVPPDPAEQRRRADADRLWGCVQTMAAADLEAAFEAADAARRLDLLPEGRVRLGSAWAELCARVRERVGATLRAAAEGRMAEAARGIEALAAVGGAGRALAARVIREAAALQGVAWDPARTGAESGVDLPAPLVRGLPVAFDTGSGVRFEGVVRAERSETVSVEVAGAGGRRFPTAPRWIIEPQSTTVDLALDQCAAALRRGERSWAVAWWVRARALGADGARLVQLGRRLGE
ncbi:MAG: hypothetical protein RL562_268 [Planctomycetota bacterium]|jgi:hypothetical protein